MKKAGATKDEIQAAVQVLMDLKVRARLIRSKYGVCTHTNAHKSAARISCQVQFICSLTQISVPSISKAKAGFAGPSAKQLKKKNKKDEKKAAGSEGGSDKQAGSQKKEKKEKGSQKKEESGIDNDKVKPVKGFATSKLRVLGVRVPDSFINSHLYITCRLQVAANAQIQECTNLQTRTQWLPYGKVAIVVMNGRKALTQC